MEFQTELKKLGLKDKEAAVYLSCLELGPSPVQPIARKARVVRATTYVILESLMQVGLVSKFKQGKKTLFSAEPPNQLLRLLEKQREEIQGRQQEFEHVLPELQAVMKAAGDRPSVRYFEGREGIHAIRLEMIMYVKPGDTLYNFTPLDHLNAVFPTDVDLINKQRIAKGIHSKTIFTTKSPNLREVMLSQPHSKFAERRFVPYDLFPGTSGFTIYNDRIGIGSYTGKLMGVIVESAPMADTMKSLFMLAWEAAGVRSKRS